MNSEEIWYPQATRGLRDPPAQQLTTQTILRHHRVTQERTVNTTVLHWECLGLPQTSLLYANIKN